MHNYPWRLGLAEGDRQHDDLEAKLAAGRPSSVPTITLEGDANDYCGIEGTGVAAEDHAAADEPPADRRCDAAHVVTVLLENAGG